MNLERILIVTKKTKIDHYRKQYGGAAELIIELKAVDYQKYLEEHAAHYAALDAIKEVLTSHHFAVDIKEKSALKKEDFIDIDLVIAVGGDGTILEASHYIDDIPIMGVNSNPSPNGNFDVNYSIGHYCCATVADFRQKFHDVMCGKHILIPHQRIETQLNTTLGIPFALNEVYIGKRRIKDASRYEISVDGITEQQISSGILVCTKDGWSGWVGNFRDAPAYSPEKEMLLCYYVIAPNKRATLLKGFTSELRMKSHMYDGVVTIDSSDQYEYDFLDGHEAIIHPSKRPLSIVAFHQNAFK